MHHCQAVVCSPYQYQYPGHNPYLWWNSKYYQKSTPRTHGGVPRSQKVPLRLSGGPKKEHGLVGEDWDCDRMEIGFKGGSMGSQGEE